MSTSKVEPNRYYFGRYKILHTIGRGEFGKVKLAYDPKREMKVAIKFIKRSNITTPQKQAKLEREISILQKLNHPNVVRLFDVIKTEKYIGMVMEYANGGELFDYISENQYLSEAESAKFFSQLLNGVHYLHSHHIVHRDLKLENLLLDQKGDIVITDFGFANNSRKNSTGLLSTSCGSPCYAAPELVINDNYVGEAADIWSCGIILYAMLCGYLPFDDDPNNPDGENLDLLYKYILESQLTFPEYVSEDAQELVCGMLIPDPEKRWNIDQVMSHRWICNTLFGPEESNNESKSNNGGQNPMEYMYKSEYLEYLEQSKDTEFKDDHDGRVPVYPQGGEEEENEKTEINENNQTNANASCENMDNSLDKTEFTTEQEKMIRILQQEQEEEEKQEQEEKQKEQEMNHHHHHDTKDKNITDNEIMNEQSILDSSIPNVTMDQSLLDSSSIANANALPSSTTEQQPKNESSSLVEDQVLLDSKQKQELNENTNINNNKDQQVIPDIKNINNDDQQVIPDINDSINIEEDEDAMFVDANQSIENEIKETESLLLKNKKIEYDDKEFEEDVMEIENELFNKKLLEIQENVEKESSSKAKDTKEDDAVLEQQSQSKPQEESQDMNEPITNKEKTTTTTPTPIEDNQDVAIINTENTNKTPENEKPIEETKLDILNKTETDNNKKEVVVVVEKETEKENETEIETETETEAGIENENENEKTLEIVEEDHKKMMALSSSINNKDLLQVNKETNNMNTNDLSLKENQPPESMNEIISKINHGNSTGSSTLCNIQVNHNHININNNQELSETPIIEKETIQIPEKASSIQQSQSQSENEKEEEKVVEKSSSNNKDKMEIDDETSINTDPTIQENNDNNEVEEEKEGEKSSVKEVKGKEEKKGKDKKDKKNKKKSKKDKKSKEEKKEEIKEEEEESILTKKRKSILSKSNSRKEKSKKTKKENKNKINKNDHDNNSNNNHHKSGKTMKRKIKDTKMFKVFFGCVMKN